MYSGTGIEISSLTNTLMQCIQFGKSRGKILFFERYEKVFNNNLSLYLALAIDIIIVKVVKYKTKAINFVLNMNVLLNQGNGVVLA